MQNRHRRWIGTITLATATCLTLAGASRVEAQAIAPPAIVTVLERLDQVLAALQAQSATLEAVQSTVDGIPGVLLTPQLTAFGRAVSCSVTNGAATEALVDIAILNGQGGVQLSTSATVPANGSRSLRGVAAIFDGLVHCHVTVTQGDKRDLRAALCVHEGTSTLDSPCIASAEAR